MSYYKTIQGVRYDRELLETADRLITGVGDGRISVDDARTLWDEAQDGQGVTSTEERTLRYILDHYNCTKAAASLLSAKLNPAAPAPAAISVEPAATEEEEPLSPRSQARQAGRNNFVSTLAFVVVFGLQLTVTYGWQRGRVEDKMFGITTMANAVLTAVVINPTYWSNLAEAFPLVLSVRQYCGVAACWMGMLAVAAVSAPELVMKKDWVSPIENSKADHLVAESGRCCACIALVLVSGATRKFRVADALMLWLVLNLAKPCAAFATIWMEIDSVDGASLSQFSVLMALLIFGVYAHLTESPSKFVAAGAITFSLYGCFLMFSPEKYLKEAFQGTTEAAPQTVHYCQMLAITMGALGIALTYSALDGGKQGEIFVCMGFVGSLAVTVSLFFYQAILGSIAGGAGYTANLNVGAGNVIVFLVGLLTIANAAAPHAKVVFERSKIQLLVVRAMWVTAFGSALTFFFCDAKGESSFQLKGAGSFDFGVHSVVGLPQLSKNVALLLTAGAFTLGALYSAAAQLSSAVQTKVLQYSMAVPLSLLLSTFFLEYDLMAAVIESKQQLIIFHIINGFVVVCLIFACYGTRRRGTKNTDEDEDWWRTNVCRWLYVQSVGIGCLFLYSGAPAVFSPAMTVAEVRIHALTDMMIGMVYVAAAQVDPVSQQKFLQYGMTGTLASIAVSYQIWGPDPQFLGVHALNLGASVYACYYASR